MPDTLAALTAAGIVSTDPTSPMRAPAGMRAAWVTGMSDDVTLKYQLELLMQDVVVEFVGVDTTTNLGLPILEVMIR